MIWICWLLIGGLGAAVWWLEHRVNSIKEEMDMLHDANKGLCTDLRKWIQTIGKDIDQIKRPPGSVANNDR